MIAYLRGSVIQQDTSGRVIVDVGGVGYDVAVPLGVVAFVNQGQTIELWIHTHVKEDILSLYGFLDRKEREVFTTMIGISGLGPKTAVGILSSCSSQELMQWIESEDVTSLSKLPKIGKKLAQQMILSLKGKWSRFKLIKQDTQTILVVDQITTALTRLGFKSMEIKEALNQIEINKNTDLKEGIKQALSVLHNG